MLKCHECDREFPTSHSLNSHVGISHGGKLTIKKMNHAVDEVQAIINKQIRDFQKDNDDRIAMIDGLIKRLQSMREVIEENKRSLDLLIEKSKIVGLKH